MKDRSFSRGRANDLDPGARGIDRLGGSTRGHVARDPGAELFDIVTDHLARDLLDSMEQAAPVTRALVSKAEADEALLDALDALEKDPSSAHQLHVVARAKAIHVARMCGKREGAA